MKRRSAACLGLSLAAALAPGVAPAQGAVATADDDGAGEPRWEAGAAAGAGWLADYPGAGESHARGLVAPLLIYRGPVLRIDRGGIRGRIAKRPDVEFDLALSGAFDTRHNGARDGMPELDWLLGVGPQLIFRRLESLPGSPALHLKARAMLATDFHRLRDQGVALDAELRWRFANVAGSRFNLSAGIQPSWADRRLQRYFYEVEPAYARAGRPAYDARPGYLGTELNLTLTRHQDERLTWFATLRTMSLHGAANTASPLLRERFNASVGAGLVWTPWRSEARAAD